MGRILLKCEAVIILCHAIIARRHELKFIAYFYGCGNNILTSIAFRNFGKGVRAILGFFRCVFQEMCNRFIIFLGNEGQVATLKIIVT